MSRTSPNGRQRRWRMHEDLKQRALNTYNQQKEEIERLKKERK